MIRNLYRGIVFLALVGALALPTQASEASTQTFSLIDSVLDWVTDSVDSVLELTLSEEPIDGTDDTPPSDEFGPVYIPGG